MALPKLNDKPKYEVVIPSTQKTVRYRPFLVKEQKVLMLAMESQDQKQILSSITDTISSCVEEDISVNKLTTFDVEYIFTQIRAKSVGETATVGIDCEKCEHNNEVVIKIDEIKIDVPQKIKKIKLNDKYSVTMRYPSYQFMLQDDVINGSSVEQLYSAVRMCLDYLETDEERINFDEETKEEVEQFLDQLDTNQFNEIMEFVNSLPKLTHDVNFKCESCGSDNKIVLEGIKDFF